MAKLPGSSLSLARLKSAGTSFRLVRSPAAPNTTITHGPAGLSVALSSSSRLTAAALAMGPHQKRESIVGRGTGFCLLPLATVELSRLQSSHSSQTSSGIGLAQ